MNFLFVFYVWFPQFYIFLFKLIIVLHNKTHIVMYIPFFFFCSFLLWLIVRRVVHESLFEVQKYIYFNFKHLTI